MTVSENLARADETADPLVESILAAAEKCRTQHHMRMYTCIELRDRIELALAKARLDSLRHQVMQVRFVEKIAALEARLKEDG